MATDSQLARTSVTAESNSFADNTIVLAAGTYPLTNQSLGQLVIQNQSTSLFKTLTFVGQGETSSIIAPGILNWNDRDIEILGSSGAGISVVFQDLAIEGGNATNGGVLGGNAALGGGLLVDNAIVTLANVLVQNNQAQGAIGATGAAGAPGKAGATGGNAQNASGGGIYLASGTLSLVDDTFQSNFARGGRGGQGGAGGGRAQSRPRPSRAAREVRAAMVAQQPEVGSTRQAEWSCSQTTPSAQTKRSEVPEVRVVPEAVVEGAIRQPFLPYRASQAGQVDQVGTVERHPAGRSTSPPAPSP